MSTSASRRPDNTSVLLIIWVIDLHPMGLLLVRNLGFFMCLIGSARNVFWLPKTIGRKLAKPFADNWPTQQASSECCVGGRRSRSGLCRLYWARLAYRFCCRRLFMPSRSILCGRRLALTSSWEKTCSMNLANLLSAKRVRPKVTEEGIGIENASFLWFSQDRWLIGHLDCKSQVRGFIYARCKNQHATTRQRQPSRRSFRNLWLRFTHPTKAFQQSTTCPSIKLCDSMSRHKHTHTTYTRLHHNTHPLNK